MSFLGDWGKTFVRGFKNAGSLISEGWDNITSGDIIGGLVTTVEGLGAGLGNTITLGGSEALGEKIDDNLDMETDEFGNVQVSVKDGVDGLAGKVSGLFGAIAQHKGANFMAQEQAIEDGKLLKANGIGLVSGAEDVAAASVVAIGVHGIGILAGGAAGGVGGLATGTGVKAGIASGAHWLGTAGGVLPLKAIIATDAAAGIISLKGSDTVREYAESKIDSSVEGKVKSYVANGLLTEEQAVEFGKNLVKVGVTQGGCTHEQAFELLTYEIAKDLKAKGEDYSQYIDSEGNAIVYNPTTIAMLKLDGNTEYLDSIREAYTEAYKEMNQELVDQEVITADQLDDVTALDVNLFMGDITEDDYLAEYSALTGLEFVKDGVPVEASNSLEDVANSATDSSSNTVAETAVQTNEPVGEKADTYPELNTALVTLLQTINEKIVDVSPELAGTVASFESSFVNILANVSEAVGKDNSVYNDVSKDELKDILLSKPDSDIILADKNKNEKEEVDTKDVGFNMA